MNTKVYKYCSVPMCKNTTIKTPDKLFIHVPKNKQIRSKWFTLAKRDLSSPITNCYYCEDHFDLPNDMENYVEYTTMGVVSQIRMRSGCLPTKFACHSTSDMSRPNTGKKRKLASKGNRRTAVSSGCGDQLYIDVPCRSSDLIKQEPSDMENACRSEISLPCSPIYIKEERQNTPIVQSLPPYKNIIKKELLFEEDTPKGDYEFLSKLQQEIEQLKRENQRLVEENRTLKKKEENGANGDQKLPTKGEDLQINLKCDNQSLIENSRLTNEIESINRKNEIHVQKQTERKQCCLAKIQKLESKIQELDRRIEDLVDGDKLAEKNQDLYEKLQYLKQKVDHLNKETAELNQQKAELNGKLRELYTQNTSLETQVRSFEDKVRGLVEENQALATELKALSQLQKYYNERKRQLKLPKKNTSDKT